ncbi:MAG: GDP-mannose 4,6-dehydratase [Candidatus Levybacteria bacterium]|nr:GDP-mannose 4,6-dehydratase [Candidatus Levybacteria bacterium]
MNKVLITGVTGFAGSYLAEYLANLKEYEVFGTYLLEESKINIDKVRDRIKLIKIDLSSENSVFDLIKKIRPTLIFHLAALTSPADSFKNPVKTMTDNIALQINILEAVKKYNLLNTKILIVSSADVYGLVKKKDLPMDEDTKLAPTSPYSVSKVAQDFLGFTYYLSYNLKIVRVRPFNHIGPRQSPNFVVASFAKQIAEIEKRKRSNVLRVGNLEAKRDFTNVKDIVRAYVLAIDRGEIGEVYNIGSGRSYKISDILDRLISMSTSKIKIEKEDSLIRPSDNPELLCDCRKFERLTNWRPEFSIDETLKDTLDYWRNII